MWHTLESLWGCEIQTCVVHLHCRECNLLLLPDKNLNHTAALVLLHALISP